MVDDGRLKMPQWHKAMEIHDNGNLGKSITLKSEFILKIYIFFTILVYLRFDIVIF
jgi:hypothetical protein